MNINIWCPIDNYTCLLLSVTLGTECRMYHLEANYFLNGDQTLKICIDQSGAKQYNVLTTDPPLVTRLEINVHLRQGYYVSKYLEIFTNH